MGHHGVAERCSSRCAVNSCATCRIELLFGAHTEDRYQATDTRNGERPIATLRPTGANHCTRFARSTDSPCEILHRHRPTAAQESCRCACRRNEFGTMFLQCSDGTQPLLPCTQYQCIGRFHQQWRHGHRQSGQMVAHSGRLFDATYFPKWQARCRIKGS